MLDAIQPKWDPRPERGTHFPLPAPPSTPISEAICNANTRVIEPGYGITELQHSFRIFGDNGARVGECTNHPKTRPKLAHSEEPAVTIYTDGSSPDPAGFEQRAGGGAWFGPQDRRNRNVRITGTNQTGEAAGALLAVQAVHRETVLKIVSDSEFVVKGLTERLQAFENRGWIAVADGDYLKALAGQIRQRRAPTYIEKVKGHSGDVGNDGADREAATGAAKNEIQSMDLSVQQPFAIHGAQLQSVSQALAVKGIRLRTKNKTDTPPRTTVKGTLDSIRWATLDATGKMPCDRLIWKSFRHDDLTPSFRSFLWRACQNGYWVGPRWLVSKDKKALANCENCGTLENWEHILLHCEATGPKDIWDEANKILAEYGYKDPPTPNIGTILGCALTASVQGEKTEKGKRRLHMIVTSRAAHMAWKVRCERVLGGKSHAGPEVRNRLRKAVEAQKTLDFLLTSTRKYGNNLPKRKALYEGTWNALAAREPDEGRSPPQVRGVLVGKRPDLDAQVLHGSRSSSPTPSTEM
ncbi:hypothetical protein EV715DRAFT_214947 [Schizophyllum commune]